MDELVLEASNQLSGILKTKSDVTFGIVAISLDLVLIHEHLKPAEPPELNPDGSVALSFHALRGLEKELPKPFFDLVDSIKAQDPLRHMRERKRHLGILFTGSYPAIERRPGKDDRLTIVTQTEVFSHEDERRILMKAISDTLRAGQDARG